MNEGDEIGFDLFRAIEKAGVFISKRGKSSPRGRVIPLSVDGVFPEHFFGPLDRLDVEIDDDRLLRRAHEDAFERLVAAGVDFLMRHEGRHVDEVAGTGFGDEFEILAPAHAGFAAHHIDDAFEIAW